MGERLGHKISNPFMSFREAVEVPTDTRVLESDREKQERSTRKRGGRH